MAPKHEDASPGTTPKLVNPVTLRLGELEPKITSRTGDRAPGAIVKRDLGRYYEILLESQCQLEFTLPEAEALVVALRGFDAAAIRYLWAEVERQYLANDENPDHPPYHLLPDDVDAAALVDKLRRQSLSQSFAVLDAVERYWSIELFRKAWPNIDVAGLTIVGLVLPPLAQELERRRRGQMSKTTGRDPAAGLRRKRTDRETE